MLRERKEASGKKKAKGFLNLKRAREARAKETKFNFCFAFCLAYVILHVACLREICRSTDIEARLI